MAGNDIKATHLLIVLLCLLALAFVAMPGGRSGSKIAEEFYSGFHAAIDGQPRTVEKSEHWLSGWDAGIKIRPKPDQPAANRSAVPATNP